MTDDDAPIPPPLDDDFPVDFANAIAKLEIFNKHHYRPNSYLHKWWARRCGSTFRLILKQLVTEEAARDYYAPKGLAGMVVLDPMMGGGTTLHEAIRLGAHVIGADIDPIPVLQARATLRDVPLVQLEKAFKSFHAGLRAELDGRFETTCPDCTAVAATTPIWFTLYGWRRSCDCREALFVDSLTLRVESDGSTIQLCPNCRQVVVDAPCDCTNPHATPIYTKDVRDCAECGVEFREDMTVPHYARYEPLVVVGHCTTHGLFFKGMDEADKARWQAAEAQREALPFNRDEFQIESGRKSKQLVQRGINNYLDLFSTRQLMYLAQAMALLPDFPDAVRLNLGLLVSTSLEFNSMLCGYKGKNKRRAGAIRHTFAHHAYSFPYTAVETNPLFYRAASGTLKKLFNSRIRRGRQWAKKPRERKVPGATAEFVTIAEERDGGKEVFTQAELRGDDQRFLLLQGSSTRLALADGSVDAIVTDPPYYDSVQYSDLAAFFRVWLRHLLPADVDWTYDMAESAVDPHKLDRESRYRELLGGIFGECRRVLKENGRFVFTFHHWNPKAWAALTLALKGAGFVLVNRYVVHAESPLSVHISNMNALLHDVVLVLAPMTAVRGGDWERPLAIPQDDSETFVRDCATLLGWVLTAPLDDDAVARLWREMLR